MAEVADVDLHQFGYASGLYACICRNCGSNFVGGRMAVTCRLCAVKRLISAANPQPAARAAQETTMPTTDMTVADLSSMRRLAEAQRLIGLLKAQLRAPLSDRDAEECLAYHEDFLATVEDAIGYAIAVYDSKLESAP